MTYRIPRRLLVWATRGLCNLRIPGKSRDTCTMWSLRAARSRSAMEPSRSIGVAQIRSCALVKQTFRIWLPYAWGAEDRPSRYRNIGQPSGHAYYVVEAGRTIDRKYPAGTRCRYSISPGVFPGDGCPFCMASSTTEGVIPTDCILTDQEKNALCDRLMTEGIAGRQDADAVARTCVLTQVAVELGRSDGIVRNSPGTPEFLIPQMVKLLQNLPDQEQESPVF